MLTRLELFLRRNAIRPAELARKSGYSRQHLLRLRFGYAGASRRLILEVAAACTDMMGAEVRAELLFEGADRLLRSAGQQLRRVHAGDLRKLNELVAAHEPTPDWSDKVHAAGIASEVVVVELIRTAFQSIDQSPTEAASIAGVALRLARSLRRSAPELIVSLQAHALRTRANALRHLGLFDESLDALALEARLFVAARYCTSESGRVEYTRGTVLFKMERWSAAAAAARNAQRLFHPVRDAKRLAHAELLEACVLFEQGDVRAAREIFLQLRAALDASSDRETLARVWLNLAACDVRDRREEQARHWLNRASGAFRVLHNTTELLRTRWNMALFIAHFRSVSRGIRALRRVQREFSRLHLYSDAALVGLDILDFMSLSGAANQDLRRTAGDVAGVLIAQDLAVSAARVISELRTLTAARAPVVIRDVRSILRAAELDLTKKEPQEVDEFMAGADSSDQ